ncbi:MAG: porin [Planctomycetota bacterium]|nr:porin [Planctomycetota bacterium]
MHRRFTIYATLLAATFCMPSVTFGQLTAEPVHQNDSIDPIEQLESQIDAQAKRIFELEERLDEQTSLFGTIPVSGGESCVPSNVVRIPVAAEFPATPACGEEDSEKKFHKLDFYADYDDGFVIRPIDPKRHPFDLKVEGWVQFRHHVFARDANTWTDNAGVTQPVRRRNAFDIERARLNLSGHVIDQRSTYFIQIDGDTDGNHTLDFFDYWWAWKFSDSFQIQMGKRKVPGSRQWLLGARRTRLIDRPMAADFFRPDRTIGVFGVGTLGDSGHYELMVGNGYSSANIPNAASDDRLTFAATNYFDLLGDFGGELVDFGNSDEALIRIGHSFVYSPQAGRVAGVPLDEADFIRLADGTRLTQPGALAPGVTVSDFDVVLYSVDAAWKHRGWSVDAELFLRWIEQIQGNGPLPVSDIFQRGFFVEGGHFLIPKLLDFNVRYSQVSGESGNASEYSAGFNWYPLEKSTMKVSFDVTSLDGSPLQNTTSDVLAGDDGTLFRTQFQAEF